MHALNGKWSYLSFRHDAIVVVNGLVAGQPELAVPWSSPGVLDVRTSDDGVVAGTLAFAAGVALNVSGVVAQASHNSPASVTLIGEGLGSLNRIKGYFIPNCDHIVGTVLCEKNDLLRQPNGTLGPFVLYPMNA